MKLQIITISHREPKWIEQAFQDYAERFPQNISLILKKIPAAKRNKQIYNNKLLQQEATAIIKSIPTNSITIALDIKGHAWSTEQLAKQLAKWQQHSNIINFLIGGPDGLAKECLQTAKQKWSLSALTLPHAMVKIIVAEQLYRAWSILSKHPYHRGD